MGCLIYDMDIEFINIYMCVYIIYEYVDSSCSGDLQVWMFLFMFYQPILPFLMLDAQL